MGMSLRQMDTFLRLLTGSCALLRRPYAKYRSSYGLLSRPYGKYRSPYAKWRSPYGLTAIELTVGMGLGRLKKGLFGG